jgi:hypothetical protein
VFTNVVPGPDFVSAPCEMLFLLEACADYGKTWANLTFQRQQTPLQMQSSARTSTMISGTFSLDLNPPIYNENMRQHEVIGAGQSVKRKVLARISVPLNPEASHRAFLVLMPHMSQIWSWANGVHRGSLFCFNEDGIHHEGDGIEPRYLQHRPSLSISLVQIPLLPHTLILPLIHVQRHPCVDVHGLSLGAAVVRSTTAQCRSRLSLLFEANQKPSPRI